MSENLYSAVYSGVPVYEFLNPKSSVMRRKKDGWINATHILKVANFPKAKRTRILERDVQVGVHEKVQGGYGKYQGTWVPMERAVDIANEFGVYDELKPLFDYKPQDGGRTPPPAPKHHHASSGAGKRGRVSARTASEPLALRKNEFPAKPAEAAARKRTLKPPRPQPLRATPPQPPSESESEYEDSDTQPLKRRGNGLQQHRGSSPSDFMSDDDIATALEQQQYAVHRPQDTLAHAPPYIENLSPYTKHELDSPQSRATPQRSQQWFDAKRSYTQQLLEYFLSTEDNLTGDTKIPDFILDPNSPFDADQVIDKDGNTTFHWACAMGDLRMCDALLNRGCNSRALNNEGQVPIMRSVLYTNSYSRRTFAKLLDLLRDSLLDTDERGRTILHHIGFSTNSVNNLPAARYYTEILLTKIAETVQPMERIINFINQQDMDGNTALHIMSHHSANKCMRVLLGYNARVDIPNHRNEHVSDYLYNNSVFEPASAQYSFMGSMGAGSQRNHLDSLSQMKPFTPSLNLHNASMTQSYLNASNYLAMPHYSETAIQVSQKSGDIIEKLGELSNAFDQELQQRDSDIKELGMILSQMDTDIANTEKEINGILKTVLKLEQEETGDFDAALAQMREELRTAEDEYAARTRSLKKLIERSQAKDLATEVQQCETERLRQLSIENEGELKAAEPTPENLRLVLTLVALQMTRKHTVDDLVSLYADASENTETIANYRRLVSKLSNVPIDEVDESLNDIEECLKAEEEEEGK
ncbi:hypothetical protein KL905_002320 [Ogataea polymorpha]|uniref:uncharacterized protein n=1 Tax=Ogataea polymorpha TaxID=460523 RepID=UPI0007F47D63|nr:uncharacterized protein OGAPODRAFT_102415 [Ogataea polymorpha]KAG7922298.1 hypothetical protein KL905_002320 [Ogataea polymorpha]KAG7926674.1 hypothetical protein KL925_002959 [Ogataea polymorpha]KAG7936491.1 hypothetical protein KL934_001958 [Ogataea polymorpha]OBA14351.1 hypothetical protein OGAPODRAFT_102415 [Ogataea polymorpha]